MIDIHAHILPGVDDGSENMKMSLVMLSMCEDYGTKGIIATPHANIPGEFENYLGPDLLELMSALEEEKDLAGINVDIYRGMEIFATEDMPSLLEKGKLLTLNGTSYFLTEFAFGEDPDFCRKVLRECTAMGLKPIIAHPERYYFIQDDPRTAYDWCISGYGLQINKGSVMGAFGKRVQDTADLLISHGLAACVASDAHSHIERNTRMDSTAGYLARTYGEEFADLLLFKNPMRILEGKGLYGYEPIPVY